MQLSEFYILRCLYQGGALDITCFVFTIFIDVCAFRRNHRASSCPVNRSLLRAIDKFLLNMQKLAGNVELFQPISSISELLTHSRPCALIDRVECPRLHENLGALSR